MIYKNDLNGSVAPIIHKYAVGEEMSTAGVPIEAPTLADDAGVLLCETTTAADVLGVSIDAPGAEVTAQNAAGTDPQVQVSVIVNPHGLYQAMLSGGATSGTALTLYTETAGSTDGLTVTTTLGTAYDDGYVWGYEGANPGVLRKLIAVDGSTGTAIHAFPQDIAVGDTFLAATFGPGELAGMQLTGTLEEINSTVDLQSTDNFRCVRLFGGDAANEGRTKSWALISIFDHLFASGGSV